MGTEEVGEEFPFLLPLQVLPYPPRGACPLHFVQITACSRTSRHGKIAEVHHLLEGEGHVMGGERKPLRPGLVVQILPGTRLRAIAGMHQSSKPLWPRAPEFRTPWTFSMRPLSTYASGLASISVTVW